MLEKPDGQSVSRWRAATYAVVLVWIVLMFGLMIADVWDETNGMVFFSDSGRSFPEITTFVVTQSVSFWRPIPTLVAAGVLHAVPSFSISWRLLRALNILLLLFAVGCLLQTIEAWSGRDEPRRLLVTVALLFSGSAVITAGWYANIFDASSLALSALAFLLMTRGRMATAGLVLGLGFFCKEVTALALAFFIPLIAAGRLRLRDAVRAGLPAAALALIYFALRGRIIPFGSASDTHSFALEHYWPSALAYMESFWRQTMKTNGPTLMGLGWMAVSLAVLRKPLLIAAMVVFLLAGTVVYWGTFLDYQDGTLMTHRNFVGRLYLLPVSLTVALLASERRTLALALLLLPIVWGGMTTFRDHARFQNTYRQIYQEARRTRNRPLKIHYKEKPLHDPVRGIEIGDFPDAPIAIAPLDGRLLLRR